MKSSVRRLISTQILVLWCFISPQTFAMEAMVVANKFDAPKLEPWATREEVECNERRYQNYIQVPLCGGELYSRNPQPNSTPLPQLNCYSRIVRATGDGATFTPLQREMFHRYLNLRYSPHCIEEMRNGWKVSPRLMQFLAEELSKPDPHPLFKLEERPYLRNADHPMDNPVNWETPDSGVIPELPQHPDQ